MQDTFAVEDNYKNPNKELSKPVRDFIISLREKVDLQEKVVRDPIVVDSVASTLAKLYEKVRRIIDWKEEHLVRRTAIERILKRNLIAELSQFKFFEVNAEKLAEPLLLEIVRSGYFESEKVSTEAVGKIAAILKKYIYILHEEPTSKWTGMNTDIKNIKERINFYNWLMEIAACELEEVLENPVLEKEVLELMTNSINEITVVIPENHLSEEEVRLQLYVASHKALYRLDDPIIQYHLFSIKYPMFLNPQASGDLKTISENIINIWKDLESDLNHPNRGDFFRVCQKQAPIFLILSDIFRELKNSVTAITDVLEHPVILDGYIATAYEERIKTLKKRLFRSAVYSVLSIFIAGIVSLLIFEIPIAQLLYGEWSIIAIVADILIPTMLMFVLVSLIKPPAKGNLVRLRKAIQKTVYENKKRAIAKITLVKKKRWFLQTLFALIYSLGGLISLWLIYWVFKLAKVPWSSLYIDTANVALVVFAAMLIRTKSKEVTIDEKYKFWEVFVDFFSIPLAKFGFWLSRKWKEYNIISVFFTTLIDAPFSTLLKIIEDWREFVKEKHAEIH